MFSYTNLIIFLSAGFFCFPIMESSAQEKSPNPQDLDKNTTQPEHEIIRIIMPGVFDLQASDFVVRMRVWGVSFPRRGEPGYNEAISFSEKTLLGLKPMLEVKRTFDDRNLKVVRVKINQGRTDFATESITLGFGWHDEKETGRFGPLVLAQLKAKRANLGIWSTGFSYNSNQTFLQKPKPNLPNAYLRNNQILPQISYWVTSFGKIHRPECTFYERGRGNLSAKPNGVDCRICGGRNSKR
jgi:hypothetical protein